MIWIVGQYVVDVKSEEISSMYHKLIQTLYEFKLIDKMVFLDHFDEI